MRNSYLILVLLLSLVMMPGSIYAQPAGTTAEANNQFAVDLYARAAVKAGNVFFSPYSLSTALGMVYEGARGVTADEMRSVLHFSMDDAARRADTTAMMTRMNAPDKAFELTTANALWVQKDYILEKSFLEIARSVYSGEARDMDFKVDAENSRITINGWVEKQTKDRIKELIPSGAIGADSRLVLTNAVYFKSTWADAFEKSATTPELFWTTPSSSKEISMMNRTGSFVYGEDDGVQLLSIPYKGKELSMVVLLPKDKDMAALEVKITAGQLKGWFSSMFRNKVNVSLPRFEFGMNLQLKNELQVLGMVSAFGGADFSGITLANDLVIGDVFHKAWVKVDEEGTEAAAATAVVMEITTAALQAEEPKEFRADHPFIFLIREDVSGEILFMGRMIDPTQQ